MKYSWEVWEWPEGASLSRPVEPRVAGYDEAPDPESLVRQLGIELEQWQRLMVWDTPGVGRKPVLIVEG